MDLNKANPATPLSAPSRSTLQPRLVLRVRLKPALNKSRSLFLARTLLSQSYESLPISPSINTDISARPACPARHPVSPAALAEAPNPQDPRLPHSPLVPSMAHSQRLEPAKQSADRRASSRSLQLARPSICTLLPILCSLCQVRMERNR